MFDKLLSGITFDDLAFFCQHFPEGVRVEYKREVAHADRVIASLANTLGGFFVVGVRTDDQNMPIFPIEGLAARPGIEEQIVQIAHTAIYPAITPAVRTLSYCQVLWIERDQATAFVRFFCGSICTPSSKQTPARTRGTSSAA